MKVLPKGHRFRPRAPFFSRDVLLLSRRRGGARQKRDQGRFGRRIFSRRGSVLRYFVTLLDTASAGQLQGPSRLAAAGREEDRQVSCGWKGGLQAAPAAAR